MSTVVTGIYEGSGGYFNLPTDLISCDHCGIVAVDTPRFGWKRWRVFTAAQGLDVARWVMHHHCPEAAVYNDNVRHGLVHGVQRSEAVEYEAWIPPSA